MGYRFSLCGLFLSLEVTILKFVFARQLLHLSVILWAHGPRATDTYFFFFFFFGPSLQLILPLKVLSSYGSILIFAHFFDFWIFNFDLSAVIRILELGYEIRERYRKLYDSYSLLYQKPELIIYLLYLLLTERFKAIMCHFTAKGQLVSILKVFYTFFIGAHI